MMTNQTTHQPTRRRLSIDIALWASAFVIGAMVIVQAGRHADNAARADMVTEVGDLVIMTAQGQNDELLYMIDNRAEDLLIYEVAQQKSLDLIRKEHLPDLFKSARASAGQ
jgi:hypothetical protein